MACSGKFFDDFYMAFVHYFPYISGMNESSTGLSKKGHRLFRASQAVTYIAGGVGAAVLARYFTEIAHTSDLPVIRQALQDYATSERGIVQIAFQFATGIHLATNPAWLRRENKPNTWDPTLFAQSAGLLVTAGWETIQHFATQLPLIRDVPFIPHQAFDLTNMSVAMATAGTFMLFNANASNAIRDVINMFDGRNQEAGKKETLRVRVYVLPR